MSSTSIFEKNDPTQINPSDPIVLFIIQLFVILGVSRILALFLKRLRQPTVVAEVLTGILLGPTCFGRIPGFTLRIFPPGSITYLNLVSELGLVFFLFIVGLEIDFNLFRKNLKVSLSVASAGMILPFSLGCVTSIGLYKQFIDPSIAFPHFLLFIGTSFSITALPVLCRILGELGLVHDKVGTVVIGAGVANDVIGWLLLALSVSLVNASSSLIVLYIILTGIAWILFLVFIIKPLFYLIAKRSGSFEGSSGPTQSIVCLTLMLVLISSWVTDQIGIAALFGGFLVGLIIPKEKGFRSALTEKIEDLVTTLFVPIYFALSGLRTNLGLLNSGIIWGWTIAVILIAFTGKFVGCFVAARACGYDYRPSLAVGSLMSCKGLIELIVLNIGYSVGIISQTVFSIFVLEALTLTFISTPLTLFFYPAHLRNSSSTNITSASFSTSNHDQQRLKFTMILERFENLSALLVFTKLIASSPNYSTSSSSSSEKQEINISDKVSIKTVRLIELTSRTSALLQASDSSQENHRGDPLNTLFNTFTSLNGVSIQNSSTDIVEQSKFAEVVSKRGKGSDMIVIPWVIENDQQVGGRSNSLLRTNPFESLFSGGNHNTSTSSPHYATFVREVFVESKLDVVLFVEKSTSFTTYCEAGLHHLFFPFFGGSDDRAMISFILQLVKANQGITASILRIERIAEPTSEDLNLNQLTNLPSISAVSKLNGEPASPLSTYLTIEGHNRTIGGTATDTHYPAQNSVLSESLDFVSFETASNQINSLSLPITINSIQTIYPLATSIKEALLISTVMEQERRRFTVCVGRSRKDGGSHRIELEKLLKESAAKIKDSGKGRIIDSVTRKALGEVATGLLQKDVGQNLLILQGGEGNSGSNGV